MAADNARGVVPMVSVSELAHGEEEGASRKLLSALFQISELTHSASDMSAFYAALHRIVGSLMYAENFYVAHQRPGTDRIVFAYFRDSVDTDLTIETINAQTQAELKASVTNRVIESGRIIHVRPRDAQQQSDALQWFGTDSVDWLGVPLTHDGNAFGALVVQSYDPAITYGESDERVLEFVCQHIAAALLRRWAKEDLKLAYDDLERRVAQRTAELQRANEDLEREIAHRERGQRLQQTLYRISRLATESTDLESCYRGIHEAISELLDARNLFIALADEDAGMLRFPYVSDQSRAEEDEVIQRIRTTGLPIPAELNEDSSPTQRVYVTRKLFLYRKDADRAPGGAVGTTPVAWLGVPLLSGGRNMGVLAVQSYDVNTRYDGEDAELLGFVAAQVATTIARRDDQAALQSAMENLEQRVMDRTSELRATNRDLRDAMHNLERTRNQLVESEKMASLGSLVAGVAHEINTPIGVAVTAASFLQEKARKYRQTAPEVDPAMAFVNATQSAADLLLDNLRRASELIRSFKQVAADQSTEDRRVFNVGDYLQEILNSLRPQIRKAGHSVTASCPTDLEIDSYPFAFYQILSNMVINSLVHGYPDGKSGTMQIEVTRADSGWTMVYCDDGVGLEKEVMRRVFEPFFTTRRGSGGTGLGMHIAYNHVVRLGGTIDCDSAPGQGATFTLTFPYKLAPYP